MALSSLALCEHHSCLARRQLSYRSIFDLGRTGLASRRIRRGIADRPYDSAPAADDPRASLDLVGRTGNAVLARFAAPIHAVRPFSPISMGARAVVGAIPISTCGLLAGRRSRIGWMAYSGGIYVGASIGTVARGRTCKFPRIRFSFLVAGCAALAECAEMVAMVDAPLPFPGHPAVRYPLRVSCLLRPCGLPGLPLHTKSLCRLQSQRPAMRRRPDVDVRYIRVPASRSNSYYQAVVGAQVPRK